jgi:Fe2+ or Zn2+ uptake regulation protein
MSAIGNRYNLSKSSMLIYEVFSLNPFKTFDVNELMEVINKDKKVISRRTAFRAVKKLAELGEIYCYNINKGTRRFQLLNNNYYTMICKKCGLIRYVEIKDINIIEKILDIHNDFIVKKIVIQIEGICEKCR